MLRLFDTLTTVLLAVLLAEVLLAVVVLTLGYGHLLSP